MPPTTLENGEAVCGKYKIFLVGLQGMQSFDYVPPHAGVEPSLAHTAEKEVATPLCPCLYTRSHSSY